MTNATRLPELPFKARWIIQGLEAKLRRPVQKQLQERLSVKGGVSLDDLAECIHEVRSKAGFQNTPDPCKMNRAFADYEAGRTLTTEHYLDEICGPLAGQCSG